MADYARLMARDGHEFSAWLAAPSGSPRGAVVIVQEIFGVNAHIRAVTDAYAADGYLAIAPCLFDRVRRGIELGYTPQDVEEGRGYMKQIQPPQAMLDLSAALNVVKHAGRVAVIGYCWGGTQAYLAACNLPVAACVSYYGTSILANLDKHPKHPVLYHFGEQDHSIPPEAIDKVRAADPSGVFHIYPAGHGFNCDQRSAFNAECAALARRRTLDFLAEHVG